MTPETQKPSLDTDHPAGPFSGAASPPSLLTSYPAGLSGESQPRPSLLHQLPRRPPSSASPASPGRALTMPKVWATRGNAAKYRPVDRAAEILDRPRTDRMS